MNLEAHFEVPSVFSLAGIQPSREPLFHISAGPGLRSQSLMASCVHTHAPTEIPADNVLLQAAQAMLNASTTWQAGKSYNDVKTYVARESMSNKNGKATMQHWHCVVSEFNKNQIPFSQIWAKLGRNQVQHQPSHLSGLMKVARVKYISELQSIWTTLFMASPPLSPRVYTIYQTSWLLEYSHKQRGIIVTLPVDMTSRDTDDIAELEEMGIRGRYLSIEHLQEMDGNIIEWRRVSCRDPGGMIPNFWFQRRLGQKMAKENVAFMTWLSKIGHHGEVSDSAEVSYTETERENIVFTSEA